MDDAKFGSAVRAVRIRQRLTQEDVARVASVRPSDVSHIERGLLSDLEVKTIRSITKVLGMWFDLTPKWQGADLVRLVNGAHAALQDVVVRHIERLPGWVVVPEASYAIYGERGAVDVLAWHEGTRTVLIIELKTLLVDPSELVRKMSERVRLAERIAASQGWPRPSVVARWIILTDTRTNRRHVHAHQGVLLGFPITDGRLIRAWLRAPSGEVSVLSFWTEKRAVIPKRVRKVRKRRHDPDPDAVTQATAQPPDPVHGHRMQAPRTVA